MRSILILFFGLITACSSHPVKPERRLVFIDVGAALGESIKAFKTTTLYRQHSWKIYAIEPFADSYNKIPKADDVTIIPKAAAERDGDIVFFKSTPEGQTTNSIYKNEYNGEKVSMNGFDFSKWLGENFTKNDYVILSMDAAGSEAVLMEKLLKDGTIHLIDRAYVEFSMDMLPDTDTTYQRVHQIIEEIRLPGIIFDKDSVEDVIAERHSWINHL